jgi:uncharacterized protein (DUF2062 family)
MYYRYFRSLLRLNVHPTKIAFSVSLGIFVGIAVPFGLQSLVILPLAMSFRSNLILAYASTYITNPITTLPIYAFIFKLGGFISGVKISFNSLIESFQNPSFQMFGKLGLESVFVFFSGAISLGTVLSFMSYCLILNFLLFYQRRLKLNNMALPK